MANSFTRDKVVLLGIESSYGTLQTTPTHKYAMKGLTFSQGVGEYTSERTTGTLEPRDVHVQKGLISPTGDGSSDLTYEHSEWMECFFDDTTSPYIFQDRDSGAGYSFIKFDNALNTYSYMAGCKMASLEISGATGGNVQISASLRGKTVDYDIADDLTKTSLPDSNTEPPESELFPFHNVTCVLGSIGGKSTFMSFNLSLTNEFISEPAMFQNFQVKQQDLICKGAGELTYTYLSDTTHDDEYYDGLYNTDVTDAYDLITLSDGTNSFAILTYGKYMSYSKDTTGDCFDIITVTKKLMGNGTVKAVTITPA